VVIATFTEMPALLQSARTLKRRGLQQVSFTNQNRAGDGGFWSFVAKETNINGNENSGAEIFDDTMRRLAFVNAVSEALSWYISTRQFQTTFQRSENSWRASAPRYTRSREPGA
jgi:hypothetical protein